MGLLIAQFLTGLSNGASLFLVASGLSLIFGVTRVVNFAHGSFYMLGAYVTYSLMGIFAHLWGFWLSVLCASLLVGTIGLLIEMVILRRIYQSPELYQLVATFGIVLIIQDTTLFLWGAEDLLSNSLPIFVDTVSILAYPIPSYDLILIGASLFTLGLIWVLFNRTRFGILVRAATHDREMVSILGVNQAWLFSGVFFLGTVLAAVGGALQLPKGGANLLMDFNILAPVFVVVVIGGMGSILGAFLAAMLISVLQVFGIYLFPQSTLVLIFAIMAVVLIFKPQGFFGNTDQSVNQNSHQIADNLPMLILPSKKQRWGVFFLLLACGFIPWLAHEFFTILLIDIMIFSLFATSLFYIVSIGGMISFGHAAFYGGGAYIAALLVYHGGAPMELALLMAPLGVGLLALIIGWFCIRLSGVYFAMLTLAFAQVIWSIAFQWSAFTGGDDGLIGIWPSPWANSSYVYYYFVLVLTAGGMIALYAMSQTPFGYSLRASRDNMIRSESIGINTRLIQLLSFMIAGGFAGLSGGLYLFSKGSVFPDSLEIAQSFDGLIMIFMGGINSYLGAILGASSFTFLHDGLSRFDSWRLWLGLTIVMIVVIFPQGLMGVIKLFNSSIRRLKKS